MRNFLRAIEIKSSQANERGAASASVRDGWWSRKGKSSSASLSSSSLSSSSNKQYQGRTNNHQIYQQRHQQSTLWSSSMQCNWVLIIPVITICIKAKWYPFIKIHLKNYFLQVPWIGSLTWQRSFRMNDCTQCIAMTDQLAFIWIFFKLLSSELVYLLLHC